MHRVALPTRRRARASSLPHGPLRIEQLETRRVCASSATLLLAGSNAPVYQGVSIVGPGTLLVGNNPPTYQPPPTMAALLSSTTRRNTTAPVSRMPPTRRSQTGNRRPHG